MSPINIHLHPSPILVSINNTSCLERFSAWDDDVFETDDSPEKMIERFQEQLEIGKISKENTEKEKEEKKVLVQKKKDIRTEIKALESQLKALGIKAKEIKEIKDNAKEEVTE